MKLCIAIPTYGRPADIVRTVATLLAQLTPECSLLVLDNDPEGGGRAALRQAGLAHERLDVRVNGCNIGGNANILRCVELSTAEYVWLLGDDDNPRPDAVARILQDIESFGRPLHLNYCLAARPRHSNFSTRSMDEYIMAMGHLSNFWLISNWVFRTDAAHKSLRQAYNAAHSWGPHLALAFEMLRIGGGTGVQRQTEIVGENHQDNSEKSGWSILNFAIVRGSLTDVPMSSRARSHFRRRLYELMGILRHCAVALAIEAERTGDRRMARERFAHIYLTNFRAANLARAWLEFTALRLLLLWPPVLLSLAARIKGREFVNRLREFDHEKRL